MRWALIVDGVVVNVVLADTQPDPDAVDVTDLNVGPGDLYDGQTFTERPETEAEADARRSAEIRHLISEALDQLTTIINAPQVSFSNVAGAQTAARQIQNAVQFEARVLRRLVRLNAALLDGTD